MDITAISADAKTALTKIKTPCKTNGPHIEPSSNKVKTSQEIEILQK